MEKPVVSSPEEWAKCFMTTQVAELIIAVEEAITNPRILTSVAYCIRCTVPNNWTEAVLHEAGKLYAEAGWKSFTWTIGKEDDTLIITMDCNPTVKLEDLIPAAAMSDADYNADLRKDD